MRQVILSLVVVLLLAGAVQANVLLDLGWRIPPVNPETDGNTWNDVARKFEGPGRGPARSSWGSGSWNSVGELVDDAGALSGVHCETQDIPSDSGNNAPTTTGYPANAEIDWWNGQGSNDVNPAYIYLTGLNDTMTYSMNIRVWYPTDAWVYGAGQYTCQGTTYLYDNAGAVVYNFPNLTPVGGEIRLDMLAYTPAGVTLPTYNGISLIELIPEPTTLSLLALAGLAALRRRR